MVASSPLTLRTGLAILASSSATNFRKYTDPTIDIDIPRT